MNLDPSRDSDFPPPTPARPQHAVDAGPGDGLPGLDPSAPFGDAPPAPDAPFDGFAAELEPAPERETPAGAAIPGGVAAEFPAFDPAALPGNGMPAPNDPFNGFAADFEDPPPPPAPAGPGGDRPALEPALPFTDAAPAPDTPVEGFTADFEDALVEGLSQDAATSFHDLAALDPAAWSTGTESGAAAAVPRQDAGPERAKSGGRFAALAFATDQQTENALRQGLLNFRKPAPQFDDPEVWTGGLRAAVSALADGYSARLVIVDVDGIPYPAGAIHELAEVCDIGTNVVAVGSDNSARSSRELLLAGVSDYLVKPITAAAVQDSLARAAGNDPAGSTTGKVVGFAGTGGSGATTLVAATALQASVRGRFVSVLDLSRTAPTTAIFLDVEPSAGLDQLLDIAAGAVPDPQMLEGVCTRRSDRISLYAYRWNVEPSAVPPLAAVEWLIDELRQRSQLVLVDGLDDPEMRFAVLERADMRVVVAEPTVRDVPRAARIVDLLGGRAPTLRVRNHTRELKRGSKSAPHAGAATQLPADVEIPFEPSLPAIADRGWPEGRIPRRLRKPLDGLTDRLLVDTAADPAALSLEG